ncbi:hypothetical protein PHYSODRAFT_307619 [Phytophthora sojae]|uniref:Uncharacterized protein n=1 Tax=Phytophthora sojae (strain P6497) TaxID=1094619 RepID=G5AFF6_PHYSP|nr:hypothetical protein PHYSODRAFT_307619 [Phytophthora sojae]EGZ05946.1 hypothetical protein PHYSODRAFT_307619 [Phytophthora sojae]|eukprot:XP_009538807.1 hypothetical protein PHYSODRAFT_307619 [Phytophthora sojae]
MRGDRQVIPHAHLMFQRAKRIFREIEGKCSVVHLDDDDHGSVSTETNCENAVPSKIVVPADAEGFAVAEADEDISLSGVVRFMLLVMRRTFMALLPRSPQLLRTMMRPVPIVRCLTRGPKGLIYNIGARFTNNLLLNYMIYYYVGKLKAPSFTGKTPEELAQLRKLLKRQRDDNPAMSQTARTRMKIDSVLETRTQPSLELPQLLLVMEKRAHQRELQYRQEKEAREAQREADRLRVQEERGRLNNERVERDVQRHEMLMTMLAAAWLRNRLRLLIYLRPI